MFLMTAALCNKKQDIFNLLLITFETTLTNVIVGKQKLLCENTSTVSRLNAHNKQPCLLSRRLELHDFHRTAGSVEQHLMPLLEESSLPDKRLSLTGRRRRKRLES